MGHLKPWGGPEGVPKSASRGRQEVDHGKSSNMSPTPEGRVPQGRNGTQFRRHGLHLLSTWVWGAVGTLRPQPVWGAEDRRPLPPLAHHALSSPSGTRPHTACPPGPGPLAGVTHGMPISNRLFWMSCLPSMMMLSWMQSSIRQPPGAHCGQRASASDPRTLRQDHGPREGSPAPL